MKQTNNAIKFLMAQYRAIFQNAYFKGLATAAVVTVGLAAGQAQAADFSSTPLAGTDEVVWDSSNGESLSGSGEQQWNAPLNVKGQDSSQQNFKITANGDNLTLSGTGSLTVDTNDAAKGISLEAVSAGTLTVDISSINVNSGLLKVVSDTTKVATIQADTITLGQSVSEASLLSGEPTAVLDLGTKSVLGKVDPNGGSTINIFNGAALKIQNSGAEIADVAVNAKQLNISGGSILLGEGSQNAAAEIKISEGSMTAGNIVVATSGTATISAQKPTGPDAPVSFNVTGGNVEVSGTLKVDQDVAMSVTGDAKLYTKTTEAQAGIEIASGGVFKTSKEALLGLTTGKNSSDETYVTDAVADKGAVNIANGGVLYIIGDNVSLKGLTLASGGNLAAKSITSTNNKGESTLKFDSLVIDEKVANSDKFNVDVVGTLTLGAGDYNGNTTGDKSFNKITAQNLAVGSTNPFNVGDTITLTSINEKSTETDKATAGTITGDFDLKADTGDLTVSGGNYNTSSNLTLTSGDLSVVNNGTNTSKLTLTGNVFFNTKEATNGKLIASGTSAADVDRVVLDASDATLSYNDNGSNAQGNAKINVDYATLKLNGDNLSELFERTTTSGAIATVNNGGKLVVTGDLELNADQIAATTITGKKSGINLTSGSLSVADTLIVNNVAAATGFSLGNNTADNAKVKANTLQTVMANDAKDNVSVLKSGTFIVTNSLVTDSTKGFEVNDKATLQLGDFKKVSNTVSTSETTNGTANYALTLNHADANLKVEAGDWTAKGLTVTLGQLTVGNDGSKLDANGNALKSSLTVDKLVASDASKAVNVTKQGTLNTKEINVDTGSITVSGNMSIAGKYTPATTGDNGTAESFGISLKDNAITLKEGSTLTLGADANHALGLADVTGVVSAVTVKGGFNASGSLVGESFSTVKLTLGKDVSFDADGLEGLKAALFGDTGTQGTISLGDAKIELAYKGTEEEPILEWKDVTADQKLVLPNFSDEKTKITTIKLTDTGPILGHFGSVQATGVASTLPIVVGNNGSLNSADVVQGQANKLFAYNEKGEVLGLSVNDKVNFALVNGGEAGKVTLGNGSSLLVDGGQANGKTVLAELTGKKSEKVTIAGDLDVKGKLDLNKVESKEGTTLNVAKDATLAGVSTLEGKTVVAGKLTAEQAFTSTGDLQVTDKTLFKNVAKLSGQNIVLGEVEFSGAATLAGQNITLGVATFKDDSAITKGQTFASDIKLGSGVELVVGTEAVTEGGNITNGTSATVVTKNLTLADGELYIDPNFNVESSIVVAGQLSGNSLPANDAGTLDGKALVLQNGILGIGLDTTNKDAAIAQVKSELAPLFKANGALDESKIGSVAYTVKKVTLGAGDQLVVDSKKTVTSYKANPVTQALYLGEKSALAIDGKAFEGTQAPVTLQTNSKIYAGKDAKVLLTGSNVVAQVKGKKLFDGNGLTLEGYAAPGSSPVLRVETINGWFNQDLTDLSTQLELVVNATKMKGDLAGVSAPVADTIMSVAYGHKNYEAVKADQSVEKDVVYGELAEGIVKDADNNFYFGKKNNNGTNKVNDQALLDRLAKATVTDSGAVIYFAPENELIDNIVYNNGSAVDAETNARLAVFGGAPQAAIEAGASTYEAISARMGVGVSGVSAAANGQGGAIWVTPVYKSADADGFNADNKSYGADVKLYGLALGADIEVAPNFKVGGMFNVGSGDADGQGLGSNVSNDFDYYGLGLYAGYSMDAFSLVADVTYTAVDNDIEGNTDLGKVNASIDSTNLSVGVTGQYKLSLSGMDVTPHAGLRYSMIDMDDYATAYSQNDSDSINIFSLPVGVTIAKEYVTDTWTVKPSFDLTLTGNFGDDEVDATAKWNSYSNLSTTVKSEIMDNFTYGAAVGVSATSGNFGLGLGINYTGSSNTDEFGVNANARYMF
ncbi:autotransporter domain-containing protein [Anaerobiospirillum sp. NML120448]|uniref:autotransporter domain-containing protein n=1 Tax=Anaerobiospirillum sp. NML120448 TaxID=2932816 RepID=UPI001FF42BDD|nr:autotransporter domain-containing protein [Anaerobiospirillum sp. NML120448]MCK0515071.1 autotransporter domain-containing protein [Anaerobiospirillum sp. NML120448]